MTYRKQKSVYHLLKISLETARKVVDYGDMTIDALSIKICPNLVTFTLAERNFSYITMKFVNAVNNLSRQLNLLFM